MATNWYRDGTISVANGSTAVTGVGTLWAYSGTIEEGDLFTLDGHQMYEIASVEDDTHLTLRTPFLGATVSDSVYAIIINFSVQPTASVVGRTMLLINKWLIREQELTAWQTAPASGDPMTPTMVTLHAWDGSAETYKSLPQLIADIDDVDWGDISGIPTEFTPAAHTQDWSTITGKPTEFTPAAHVHSGADITSGTIDAARLGTAGTRSSANLLRGDNTWAASLTGNFSLEGQTTETRSFEIGTGRTGDGASHIDLITDATYTDYGARFIRAAGVNGATTMQVRGTGGFHIINTEQGGFTVRSANVTRINLDPTTNLVSFPVNGALGGLASGVTINGAAGTPKRMRSATNGLARWEWGGDGVAETGTNLGTNFVLNRYDDTGALLSAVLYINRDTGLATFNHGMAVAGGNLAVTGGITATGNITGSNQITSKAGAGSNAHFYLKDDLDVNQGLLFWDRASDRIYLRRYNAAGTSAEGQLSLEGASDTDLKWNGITVLTTANVGGGNYGIKVHRALIGNAVDLNTYTETGLYHQNTNAQAAAGTNYPIAQAGALDVYAASTMVYQTYTVFQTGSMYRRTQYSGVWGPWYEMYDTRNLNPASIGSTPRFLGVNIGADTDLYLYEGATNQLNIRTGPSSAYKYFGFNADGSFAVSNGGIVVAGPITGVNGLTSLSDSDATAVVIQRFADQALRLYSDGSGAQIIARSATSNAKSMIFDVTTDAANTAPTAGANQMYFRVRGQNALMFADDRSATFWGAVTINSGLNTISDIRVTNATEARLELNCTAAAPGRNIRLVSNNNGNTGFYDVTASAWALRIDASNNIFMPTSQGQKINLYDTQFAIGVQSWTQYYRSGKRFSWYVGGEHSNTENDPGSGGSLAMSLVMGGAGLYLYNGWFRTQASGAGWYHEAHGGGWRMSDSTWIRNYNDKPLHLTSSYTNGIALHVESVSPTIEFYDTSNSTNNWLHCNDGSFGFLAHNSWAWACYRNSSNNWVCQNDIIAFASDGRLKTNVLDVGMSRVNSILMGIRVRTYDWDAAALAKHKIGGIAPKKDQIGAIAQEVQAVFPDAVVVNEAHNQLDEDPVDILTIQWEKFVPLLIAKVQELERRLAEVEG